MDVDGKKCCFCGSGSDDEVIYGKFYEMNGIQTHYYCLLLSSNMQQHGKDDEGILGFLITDIQKEISRGKRLKCSYCHKNGATLGCCKPKCKKVFHLPCGRLNNSLHHFFGEFKSYCSDHRPVQAITTPVLEDSVKSANDCAICFEIVECWPNTNTLWAPCCSVNSWFHRNCIQKLALSAGYFFKCPLCNNKDYFQVSMLKQGIYIPEQDASWELVPNAFAELLERYEQCDADICLCPMGRKGVSHRTRWDIVLCRLCGSQGIHIGCGKLKTKKPVWDCSNCTSMLESAKMRHSTSVDQSGTISNSIDEPEEVNNSDRMRRSRQLLSNTVSQDTGCSRNIDNESHLSNIIGDGEPRSNNKAIKSDTKIETIPSDDDIQDASAILGNVRSYATRSRVRESRYYKNWATKMLFYKEKYNLKEVKIVLRRCDKTSLHSKEEGNKVFTEYYKNKELATIPFSGLKHNIKKSLLLQFCCKGIFRTEDYAFKNEYYSVESDFRTNNLRAATSKLERSQSFERYHTESLSTVITDSNGENVDMKMYSNCFQMEKSITNYDSWTNNSLLESIKSSAFICTSKKQDLDSRKMLETKINADIKPSTFSVSENLKHNYCNAQISVQKQIFGNKNSKIFKIIGNMLNQSYNVSKIFYNIPLVSDSRRLDIELYGKIGNDWNKTCTPQHLFSLDSSFKSFNFSLYRQFDINLECYSSMKRKLINEIPIHYEPTHTFYNCNNCAIETSTCVASKVKTLKYLNKTSKYLQHRKRKDLSDYNVGSNSVDSYDCYSEKKIKKFKSNHHFSDFSNVNHEETKFNVSGNSYDFKFFQYDKIDSLNSDTIKQGKALLESERNIVSSSITRCNKKLSDLSLYESSTLNEICTPSNSIKPRKDFVNRSVKQQVVDNITLGTKVSEHISDKHDITFRKLLIKETLLQEKFKQNSVVTIQSDCYPVPQVFKTLNLECDYLFNKSEACDIFCLSEKYGFGKDKRTFTGIRYPEEYQDQVISLNEERISCQSHVKKSFAHNYIENDSDILNKPFGNKLRDEHKATQTGGKGECLFNVSSKNLYTNRNSYQINQNALHSSSTLESSNIQDPKQTSRKSLCHLLNKFRQSENCYSKTSFRRGTLHRESDENALMMGKSRNHFQRNCTDLKHTMKVFRRTEKNNVFNMKTHCPGSLYSENKMAISGFSSPHSDLYVRSSHSQKKSAINELKRLGAISHRPNRTTVKQMNSESLLKNCFDSHTEKVYRGLGVTHSVLK